MGPEQIRPLTPEDTSAVVRLSLRAWEPVFDSVEPVLGHEIFGRLYPHWRSSQEKAVRTVCATDEVWVSELGGSVVGFVAARLSDDELQGEITMVAVDPDHQGRGIGTALTRAAIGVLRDGGAQIAVVETGGDPGHAPARRTYEKAGFTLLPIARYFLAL